MEDIAKAPLNQAHFLDRKAESYAKRQLFEKSIQCRERAIENLNLACSTSLTDDTLISLQLQISHHRQQIGHLQERHRQRELKMPSVTRTALDSNKARPSSSSHIPDSLTTPVKNAPPERKPDSTARKSDLELLIRNEILKGDRLLDHLVSQQHLKSDDEGDADLDAAKQQRQHNEMISSAIKLPKPVEQVLEELQCHNDQLKSLMGSLFEELEALKAENCALRGRLAEYEKQSDLKDASKEDAREEELPASGLGVDLPPLAPLEMPEMPALVLKPRVKVPTQRKTNVSE
ncbi:hypothetical protein BV898_16548 [Hypsibius exemplaris]|uniref:Nuclear receptor-binding factor 2 MIT domain-containing protein n=1 Tax=Hypsibius exemplaris TaxID=2072580 RepID=A0A9X6RLK5_HYPEX|nr:hypothetical protein BV898_16548 [Hypsibius exemplaris]